MDHMHWWGKKQSVYWYEAVVETMDKVLDDEEEMD
jgi:hypothetical protein